MPNVPADRTASPEPADASCTKCGSPACLALVRGTTPPANWIDFLDRLLRLVSSGHWTWIHIAYLTAITGALAVILVLLSLAGPGWPVVLGGAAAVSVLGVRLFRRR